MNSAIIPEISVIVPARNEEASLPDCLSTLVGQSGVAYEVIVVDDHSTDRTRAIAESFPVHTTDAGPLPAGWSGKCNAAWTGAKAGKGKWLLFTDADTTHAPNSIATGLQEAKECGAALLSYSPRQEVHGFFERALMPVIFAELAVTFRPKQVSDPNSPAAAANGQYLLISREAYDAVGGHAAVAKTILEDVELAKLVKGTGYKLQFRQSNVVSTRMYRSFGQMWEGWTKNLALLFPGPRSLGLRRMMEFLVISALTIASVMELVRREVVGSFLAALLLATMLFFFYRRIRRAHFGWLSSVLAICGLPLFALLLFNSYISHERGLIRWKGREYAAHPMDDFTAAAQRAPKDV